MKPNRAPMFRKLSRTLAAAALGASAFLAAAPAGAAETDLSNLPLANATTVDILPNIMFILDDSGSMDWNYMPDYVNDGSYCRSTSNDLTSCREGDPPWYASAFNKVYYNPMVNYTPPKNADGTSKTSYTTWTAVPVDGYGIQFSGTINLTTSYPERVACDNAGDDVDNPSLCKSEIDSSNAYSYPTSTYNNVKTKYGAPFYYSVTVEWCSARETSGSGLPRFGKAPCQSKKTITYQYPRYTNWSRVNITPATTSYPGPNGTTRTYAEEMTNFANWYAWYRTRMQMTKTGVSQAFVNIRGTPNAGDPDDKNYFHARVGFTTINYTGTDDGSRFLAIGNFDTSQKNTWFTRLFAINPSGYTPLRQALVKAGRIYAGVIGTDPIQYSCQRNFSILSTDGYYNDSSTDANKMDGSTDVGDQDGDSACSTIKRPSCDKLKKSNTLADVAYYYYHTDLRSSMDNNVRPTGTNTDIDDIATHQHMTTFTIGLGVDGTLAYQDGYKTSTSGDYYNIVQGTTNWPNPGSGDDQKIDDLWHAAVNGRGTYFSARDPESLVNGLASALGAMESTTGSGAAAATSNLQPTAGDNYIYIANYRTMNWDGELSAYTIDLSSGVISSTATWQAGALLNAKIGTAGDTDTRAIYTWAGPGIKLFNWSTLSVTEQAYFNNNQLSQYADWSVDEKAAATGSLLVNFLRGQSRYEDQDRVASFGTYYRLYRDRENTLGDIVHSQPVYVKAPLYGFADSGYTEFKNTQSGRAGTIYVAANDGMLHAFDGASGQESWAYVPPMMLKNMWRLADRDYATNHRFFLDGPVAVSDANVGGGWKTILVGALGKGGRGYYAMDITNPATPQPLWNFTVDNDPNVGYSYGTPMITKLADGTWVVLVTSGYNNVPESGLYPTADGKGHLYVLNAATGAVLKDIPTGVGNTGYPSGLARINIKVPNFELDNTALAAYGGDLYGNMWRFDLEAGSASLVMSTGSDQPVTAAPELAEIDGKTVLFFGTGRYLGQTDLDDARTQAFYAVRDDGSSTVGTADLVQQILSGDSITANDVDWNTSYGWYFNLPSPERVHLDAQIYFGSVIFATTLPSATECQPGGSGKLYIVDYRDGSDVDGAPVVYSYQSPIVGITVAKLPGGTPVIYGITADGGVPQGTPPTLPIGSGSGSASTGRRVMWRELLD
ncbi:MAG: PilC/PilY family type IV pilus protein [Candidatus Nitricoxidivorans perseverans]|uniref:PilC/PilY family type IV pilus protein n=1 Tax=Candidatus Nitricoxidivorans perseverans TaxID=2975601 RepID=A0AA49IYZ9_9PROT|nr:MAG: PilC/PilY family type IV pilus protein [Candidatus Nitricoxidivorans perseverans]